MTNESIAGRTIQNGNRPIKYGWFNPGDLGINVASLPLRMVDGMPADSYVTSLANKILDVRERALYSRKMIAAGTTVKKGKYSFFDKTKNDTDKSLDGSLTIGSLLGWTNMVENGKVAGGHNQIAESLQVRVIIPTREFNALDATSQLPSDGTNAAAADTKSATNDYLALAMSTKITLSEPDFGEFASGPIMKFPSNQVPFAALGGGTNEGFVCNGGRVNYLRFIRVLQEMHHFDLELEFYNDVKLTHNVYLDAAIDGLDFIG